MASFGLWSRIVDRVMRRPVVSAVASVALLLALAAPALQMTIGSSGADGLPQDLPLAQKFHHLEAAFPRETSSLSVVVTGRDVTAPAVTAAVRRLERATQRQAALFPGAGPFAHDVSADKTVDTLTMQIAGDGTDAQSGRALDALRDDLVPVTLGRVRGVESYTTGATAVDRDFSDSMVSHLPLVFGFVIVSAFLLLLVTFRSLVIAIKSIVLNLLGVDAAYGVLTWVIQDGHFEKALGFHSNGGITSWLPLFLFVVLFGLSMDYHVFILSRIREGFDRGLGTERAISDGIKATASVVTSAAIVMVAVFSIFATLSMLEFKQMGIGLAVAILIDATIIRGVLLPAAMKLLGEWNWYLPRWLEWLPRFDHAPAVVEPARTIDEREKVAA
jgi:RND superfamily putative drug exporter